MCVIRVSHILTKSYSVLQIELLEAKNEEIVRNLGLLRVSWNLRILKNVNLLLRLFCFRIINILINNTYII